MVSEPFAAFLRSGRSDLNDRFAEARRRYRDLDADAFARFLDAAVGPLVDAVASTRPDRTAAVASAAYDAALDLVGQRLAGPGARGTVLDEAWRRVLPALAPLIAVDPDRLLGALTNVLHNVAAAPGSRPARSIEVLERLGPRCADPGAVLALAMVAAWRAGLAHLREAALDAADALPPSLAAEAAGGSPSADWAVLRERLRADPWFDPGLEAAGGGGDRRPRFAARVGAFRGFGGQFLEPPLVVADGAGFLVRSGGESWTLVADAFGATFRRAEAGDLEAARAREAASPEPKIAGRKVVLGGLKIEVPTLLEISSAAVSGRTLAVTSPYSHALFLVALP
jgi:hypothetical protein